MFFNQNLFKVFYSLVWLKRDHCGVQATKLFLLNYCDNLLIIINFSFPSPATVLSNIPPLNIQ